MLRSFAALCLSTTALVAEPPNVATDIAPVHALVSQVMGDLGSPALIVDQSASPHGYAMRPSEARALEAAELVVTVGPRLTPWLEGPLDALAGDAHRLVLMELPEITLMPFREGARFEAHDHDHGAHGHDDHGHDHAKEDGHKHDDHETHASDDHDHDHDHDDHAHAEKIEDHDHDHAHDDHAQDDHAHGSDHAHDEDHAHGDDHAHGHDHAHEEEHAHDDHAGHDHHDHAGGLDPHIWLDPRNGSLALAAIAAELSELDPENAETYARNAEAGQARLAEVEEQIAAQLAPSAGKPFLVFHDAYHYFEARFGVEAAAAVSAGDAATPGAARIAELRAYMSEVGAVCAFAEPQMNVSLLETVVEGQPTRLGTLDPLGSQQELGASLYPEMLLAMSDAISTCLTPSG